MKKSALITRRQMAVVALFLLLCAAVSCRMVDSLTGGDSAGTVSNLWPDVPPFEGAAKTDLQFPVFAKLILRAAMQGKINFIAFTTTKGPEEVRDFYTVERMKTFGWSPTDKGCVGDTDDKKKHGLICFFQRKDGDKQEGLAIIVAESEKEKKTDIFYARIDMTQPTPSPSR